MPWTRDTIADIAVLLAYSEQLQVSSARARVRSHNASVLLHVALNRIPPTAPPAFPARPAARGLLTPGSLWYQESVRRRSDASRDDHDRARNTATAVERSMEIEVKGTTA